MERTVAKAAKGSAGSGADGILPAQGIRALIRSAGIRSEDAIGEDQIQPASLDLRLGSMAYRVRASFLPGPDATVTARLKDFQMHAMHLADGAVLERGCVYIVPVLESLALPETLSGVANPKSSVGRLDVFTRLITDDAVLFDHVPLGYRGPLFVEVSPRTFSIVVRQGTRLNQLRLIAGSAITTDASLRRLHQGVPLVDGDLPESDIGRGIPLTVDLSAGKEVPVGYRARRHADLIDLARVDHYPPEMFWEPVQAERGRTLTLNPGDFYILASREAVTVPPDHAAEMRAYDTQVGEFRVHYAGFFDPGFGYAGCGGVGSRAVLEIRSFEIPFVLRHGQLVGRLVYERLAAIPDKLYGPAIGSAYQRQGLMLAKQFRRVGAA